MLRLARIPSATAVDPAGAARSFDGGSTGVLVLHGWTGNTSEFAYLGAKLADAGFTVRVPRLPGHGTNGMDFLQSGWRDWLRKAIDAYLDLAREVETVYVIGLSMGGVLTAILASHFAIDRIVLYAPAITNRNRLILLTPVARFFAQRMPKPFDDEDLDPQLANLAKEYWHYQWISPAYQLLRLQRIAKRRLRHVRAETLVIVSRSDNSVPISVADLIERKTKAGRFERVELLDSGHVLVNGVDREEVADRTIAWLSRT